MCLVFYFTISPRQATTIRRLNAGRRGVLQVRGVLTPTAGHDNSLVLCGGGVDDNQKRTHR